MKRIAVFIALLGAITSFTACGAQVQKSDALQLVATTTMLADLSAVLGGTRVQVHGLMGQGIDPHLYQASAGDVARLQQADVIVYNGLHLEGKMGELFEHTPGAICVGDGLDPAVLLTDASGAADPHIWFDVRLWQDAARIVAAGLCAADPDGTDTYTANLTAYLAALEETDAYIRSRTNELPADQRVLVTAHDAFGYFGRAYGFTVRGLQGINTNTEAGTADMRSLADFIASKRVRALFVETSVPPKNIEALQAAVQARGFRTAIGGTLYSDSLGDEAGNAHTYILTARANIDTIVQSLCEP